MALIDDLIEQVKPAQLQANFRDALRELRKSQQFGLNYEAHIPETITIPGIDPTSGALVRVRTDSDTEAVSRILSVNGSKAVIQSVADDSKRTVAKKDLLIVKRFGDPIYPSLEHVKSVKRGATDRPNHAVINGENFHVLQLLLYLYEGQVDCIYIDPPYNTGARDWKYNNRYVDANDGWRHSKWLSFMQKRLALAKRLLKKDGVLVITVDKNEHYHLGVLLEQELKAYESTSVCIVHNATGAQGDNFSYTNEFAVFVVPNGQKVIAKRPVEGQTLSIGGRIQSSTPQELQDLTLDLTSGALKGHAAVNANGRFNSKLGTNPVVPLRDWGGEEGSSRFAAANCFYPILIKGDKIVGFGEDRTADKSFHPPHEVRRKDGIIEIWPIDGNGKEKKWRYARQSVEAIRDTLSVELVRGVPQIMRTRTAEPYKTVWYGPRYDAKYYGTQLVKKLAGTDFPYPKSVLAVRDTLHACVADRPDALILDFFAGSGTTLHATCLLNKQLGGARRCILVTNNEVSDAEAKTLRKQGLFPGDKDFEAKGIFEDVTLPRVSAAVSGEDRKGKALEGDLEGRPLAEGYPENVAFFRTKYLDPDAVDLGLQFKAILPSLWLAAGGVGDWEDPGDAPYSIPKQSNYAVLLDDRQFGEFLKSLRKRPDISKAWLVTDSEEAFAEMSSALPATLESSMLYRDYLRNFSINTRLPL